MTIVELIKQSQKPTPIEVEMTGRVGEFKLKNLPISPGAQKPPEKGVKG